MISILIVDDEVKILDSLEKLIRRLPVSSLQVFKACSAAEALDCMRVEKIHVVLLDIRMPGMNGIELQREINARWPLCKVIFLTGYSDFEYVQSALRNGAVDYLLKTEDNETILAAVMKAVESVTLQDRKEAIIRKGKDDWRRALPILQKELLGDILDNKMSAAQLSQDKLDELQIPLRLDEPVVLCLYKIDEWKETFTLRDKQLMSFALNNIAGEIFGPEVRMISHIEETGKGLWIMQPSPDLSERFLSEIQPRLESIQETCKQMLDLKISLVVSLEWTPWEHVASTKDRLQTAMYSGFGLDEKLLIQLPVSGRPQHQDAEEEFLHLLRKMSILSTSLEEGDRKQFFEFFDHLRSRLLSLPPHLGKYKIETYYSLGLLFVTYLNKRNMSGKIEERMDLSRLYAVGFAGTDKEILEYFAQLADVIFETNLSAQLERNNAIVEQVNHYINKNLHNELSLNIIGDAVGYNPSYLSRIYKHLTGIGIAEFIMNRRLALAKMLLKETNQKIYDIAKACGFLSVGHFFRIFKKTTSMTPAEYRDLHANHSRIPLEENP